MKQSGAIPAAQADPPATAAILAFSTATHAINAAPISSMKDPDQRMPSSPKADLKSERVVGFASCELVLDILYTTSSTYKQDVESIWIILCVMQNTLREVINDPTAAALYLNARELPESMRPCMSRRAIADKTGLSRETVRRRTNKLIDSGALEEVNGAVRLANESGGPGKSKGLNQIHAAVAAYLKRIEDHNIDMPL